MSQRVTYMNPNGRVNSARLGAIVEEFEEAHGKAPAGFAEGATIDILVMPLDDGTGFEVSSASGADLAALPANYEEFVKGEIQND